VLAATCHCGVRSAERASATADSAAAIIRPAPTFCRSDSGPLASNAIIVSATAAAGNATPVANRRAAPDSKAARGGRVPAAIGPGACPRAGPPRAGTAVFTPGP